MDLPRTGAAPHPEETDAAWSTITIATAGLAAQIAAEAGGRLARLSWRRRSGDTVDIVVPMTSGLAPPGWPKAGAYPLVPYANRIAQARLSFLGRVHDVAPHPDAHPHSLHGHTHLEPWAGTRTGENQADLSIVCERSQAWPWAFEARQRFTVQEDRLVVSLSLRNLDREPMPAGLGWHPYFLTAGPAEVTFAADTWWPYAADFLPLGQPEPLRHDLQPPLVLGNEGLTAYLGHWSGEAELKRDDGVRIALTADGIFDHLVLHRPAGAAYCCLEPVSHVANGFNLAADGVHGAGLRILDPGGELAGSVTVALSEVE
jgi:aldose 1-epimerase